MKIEDNGMHYLCRRIAQGDLDALHVALSVGKPLISVVLKDLSQGYSFEDVGKRYRIDVIKIKQLLSQLSDIFTDFEEEAEKKARKGIKEPPDPFKGIVFRKDLAADLSEESKERHRKFMEEWTIRIKGAMPSGDILFYD